MNPQKPDPQPVVDLIKRHTNCLIVTHINPEGDAIGSMLALAMAMDQLGINVYCYDRDGVPENCRFMHTWERVSTKLPLRIPPLVIYVDADRLERCGLSEEQLAGAQEFGRVDHHVSTGGKDIGPAFVNSRAAATGELMHELVPALGAKITPEIATCLQAALMVDTGRFSYTNTTPDTHRIAAELLAAGSDVATIVDWIWGSMRYEAAKLLGSALESLQVSEDGSIAWAVLRAADYKEAAAVDEDTEGIIDYVRCIKGTEVAALFSERRGKIRVSLRSHGHVNVAKLAAEYGGGGHVKAAGLTFDGPMEYAICEVLKSIEKAIETSRG